MSDSNNNSKVPVVGVLPGSQVLDTVTAQRTGTIPVWKTVLPAPSNPVSVSVQQTEATPQTPAVCTNVSATESAYKTQSGQMLSLVSVSYTNTDPTLARVDIYFKGYNGSTTPQLVTSGTQSPISFLCNTTQETVTVSVVAVNANGAYQPIADAPTCTVTLDGVTSPPPPPSIASPLVQTPIGYSFSFYAEEGLLADVVDGYRIYRNTANTFTGATQIDYKKQSPDNTGTIEVQDSQLLSSGVNYFYWVTAVNTSGLESSPTAVGPSTTGGIPQQVTNVSATESPYKTQSGEMKSLVAVDFTPAANDPYFCSVQIWFSGYNGSSEPQLMAEAFSSPVQFLCETTHETVAVSVLAVSPNKMTADATNVPTTLVSLDGVASPPPYPSIAQAQVALPNNSGWQFAFNVIGGLEADTIDCYRIYHGHSSSSPDGWYKDVTHNAASYGTHTVQEITQDILYYWVSAVNTSGLESPLTPVPFTYVDPNNPAPPATVTTTKSYYPVTSLNGWGNNAHVGDYEGGGGQSSRVWGTNNDTTYAYSNPDNAIDGNENTCATASFAHTHKYAGCIWSFSNFSLPAGATVSTARLKVLSEAVATSGFSGRAELYYSLDGGSTWTCKYCVTSPYSKQYDYVNLTTTQDFTKIQVMAFVDSHDDAAQNVYVVGLEVTAAAPAIPEKVTGVKAQLVSGNVQISWNALQPLSRTDITEYQIYRCVHGGGYAHSYLHGTVASNGAASYGWTDPQGHDGTFDYYVLAHNSTGYSAPSDVATLYSATSTLYANGLTVDSLRPAQAGADITGQHTSADTTYVSGIAASTVGTGGLRGYNALTGSYNLVSGAKLGGDSGVSAYGSSSMLGFGGTPGQVLSIYGQFPQVLYGGSPGFHVKDTRGGDEAIFQMSGPAQGTAGIYRNGSTRYYLNGSGSGFEGSPVDWITLCTGGVGVRSTSPYIRWLDNTSGIDSYLQNSSGTVLTARAGSLRYYLNGTGHGFDMSPNNTVTINTGATINGGNPFIHIDDSYTGTISYLQNWGGNIGINRNWSFRYMANGTGNGFDMTPSVPFHVGVGWPGARLSGYCAALWLENTGTSGRSYTLGSRDDFSGGFVIGDENVGHERFVLNTSGHLGLGCTPSQPFMVSGYTILDGDIQFPTASSRFFRKQGSIMPSQTLRMRTISTTTTSVTFSWDAMTVYFSDGSSLYVSGGSKTFAGLSTGTTYFFYFYVRVSDGTVQAVSDSPATSQDYYQMLQMGFDGRIPFGAWAITTNTTGGGSYGGDLTCPESAELVEIRGKGEIPAGEVQVGDFIKGKSFVTGEDIYRKVVATRHSGSAAWRVLDGHRVSPCESVYCNGEWAPAFRASKEVNTQPGTTVHLTVESDIYNEQNFYLVGGEPLLIHNALARYSC